MLAAPDPGLVTLSPDVAATFGDLDVIDPGSPTATRSRSLARDINNDPQRFRTTITFGGVRLARARTER